MEIQRCKVSTHFPLESRLSLSLNRFHSPETWIFNDFLFDNLAAPTYKVPLIHSIGQKVSKYDLSCSIATTLYSLYFGVDIHIDKRYGKRSEFNSSRFVPRTTYDDDRYSRWIRRIEAFGRLKMGVMTVVRMAMFVVRERRRVVMAVIVKVMTQNGDKWWWCDGADSDGDSVGDEGTMVMMVMMALMISWFWWEHRWCSLLAQCLPHRGRVLKRQRQLPNEVWWKWEHTLSKLDKKTHFGMLAIIQTTFQYRLDLHSLVCRDTFCAVIGISYPTLKL